MKQRELAARILIDDGVRRTGHAHGNAQPARKPARKGGLSRAQLAKVGNDLAAPERFAQTLPQALGFFRAVGEILHSFTTFGFFAFIVSFPPLFVNTSFCVLFCLQAGRMMVE